MPGRERASHPQSAPVRHQGIDILRRISGPLYTGAGRANPRHPDQAVHQKLIPHLTIEEVRAILNAPDLTMRLGLRDRAMLHLCFAAGLRVSEWSAPCWQTFSFSERRAFLSKARAARSGAFRFGRKLRPISGLAAGAGETSASPNSSSMPKESRCRARASNVLDKHASAAADACPPLRGRSISPHQLRHSCAVIMLQATRDVRKVALWLGHADIRTTGVYLRVDTGQKLRGR